MIIILHGSTHVLGLSTVEALLSRTIGVTVTCMPLDFGPGKEHPDAGTCKIHKDVHLVMFEQDPQFIETATVTQNLFNQDHPTMKAISNYEMAMESEDEDLITNSIMEMEENNAWDFESKVKTILTQLNIHHLEQPVAKLSGGQRKRVSLG